MQIDFILWKSYLRLVLKDFPGCPDPLVCSKVLPAARWLWDARPVAAEHLLVLGMHSGICLLALEANLYAARAAIEKSATLSPDHQ